MKVKGHPRYLKLMWRHAGHSADRVDTLRTAGGLALLVLGIGGGLLSWVTNTLSWGGIYALLSGFGVYMLGKAVWDEERRQSREVTAALTERIERLTVDLARYTATDPRIVVFDCREDQKTTPWFVRVVDARNGAVGYRHLADNWFSHIFFANQPEYPDDRSIATQVTADLEWFRDGQPALQFTGRWANNPEHTAGRDPRSQQRIDIPPDGLPVSLDVTIRNPAAYAVFGYNDSSLLCDRGYNDALALSPGNYRLKVTLRGIRLPATTFWFDVDVAGPASPVSISRS